jgi:hypothetical protein
VIATLAPEPGKTPIADEYRAFVTATARVSTDPGVFDVAAYDPASVREASARWKRRMADEYASTTVFAGLVPQLVEANATLDASAIVMRMAQDELRHAEICGRVVTAMGGTPRVARDTTVQPIAVHAGCGPEERALRNVIVTAISETYSTAFFVASLDLLQDDYLRVITRTLLADEVLHGRFGFYYLQGWSDWLGSRPEVRASISKYLRHVFAVVEREFVRQPNGRGRGADDDALGLVSSELGREIFEATMEQAVAPGLDRFGLDATRAWRTRSLGEG